MSGTTMPNRPMSIKEISTKASEYVWNPNVPIKYWLRAAETLHQESQVYLREGNLAQAYLLLLRYSSLVLHHLLSHPEANEPEAKKALKKMRLRAPAVLGQLEGIKPQLQGAYDEWVKISAAQRDRLGGQEDGVPVSPHERYAANDPALSWNAIAQANLLDAGQNQELAVDLARKEMRRRRRQPSVVTEEEEQRRRGAGLWDGWDEGSRPERGASALDDDELELRRQMESARRHLNGDDLTGSGDKVRSYSRPQSRDSPTTAMATSSYSLQRPSSSSSSSLHYKYPSINKSTSITYDSGSFGLRREPRSMQPPIPPKESIEPSFVRPPRVPRKEPLERPALSPPPGSEVEDLPPPPPRPPKTADVPEEAKVTFRPAAYLENGEPVRPVFLPKELRHSFLKIAAENTRRGLELCGILCGAPVNNALFIQCLLIPEQRCTSDTCETENESAMLDYCIANDYLMVGWIHTHPTQTCFMSSRDLHTQAGYQVMMPESIAIVCAPRHEPSWGIFRLTHPPGLQYILNCTDTDTFHQHSIDRIYTGAGHPPGHVYESENLEFVVHDLRG